MGPNYWRVQWMLLALALTGCGGGGGASGGGSGGSSTSISTNTTSINLSKTIADAPLPINVLVSIRNAPTDDLWAAIDFEGAAVNNVNVEGFTASGLFLTVYPSPYGDLPPGSYVGNVAIYVCEDEPCRRQVSGSPIQIPVTLAVTGVPLMSIAVDPAGINVVGAHLSPVPQIIGTTTLSLGAAIPVNSFPAFTETHSGQFIQGMSIARPSPTTIEVSVILLSPDSLSPGTHSDLLSLDFCYASQCVHPVSDAPVAIPVRYVVRPEPAIAEPGIAPWVPNWTSVLTHDVIDAEYSDALEAIVAVSSYPSNALYVYDVNARTEKALPLDRLPTSVSVSPDGLAAAVGHERLVTYVDLTALEIPGGQPATLLNLSTEAYDIVLGGRGYVHVLPIFESPIDIRSIEIATSTEQLAVGTSLYAAKARLHPSGDYLYTVSGFASPADIEKFDIRSVPITRLYDSRYHGDYGTCDNLWVSESGLRVFTACGHAFLTAELEADDLIYDGTLSLSSVPTVSAYVIRSLSTSESQDEIALIEEDFFDCTQDRTPSACFPHVSLYDGAYRPLELYGFAPVTIDGFPYGQRGLFIFHSSDGARKFLVHKVYGAPDPDNEFFVSEF